MAFTEAQLQAQIDSTGLCARITQFNMGATTTDVYVQNVNNTSDKSGWTQILNTQTAAQAAANIATSLG